MIHGGIYSYLAHWLVCMLQLSVKTVSLVKTKEGPHEVKMFQYTFSRVKLAQGGA